MPLPPGYTLRPSTLDDVQAVYDLMVAVDVADFGESDMDLETVRNDLADPNHDLERDSWLVHTPEGRLVGYGYVFYDPGDDADRDEHEIEQEVYLHPDFNGLGIDTHLLALTEARARAIAATLPAGKKVTVGGNAPLVNAAAMRLYQDSGWETVRYFYRMEIDMAEPPPAPDVPAGFRVRPFNPTTDAYATYEAVEEAFEDQWGHTRATFEDWKRMRLDRDDFDPSLWHLAFDGDRIAGLALGWMRPGTGWLRALGVRRPWRRRGLGRALLLHALNEFYRRGQTRVGLGVDASSPSGATVLYEQVGMRVTRQYAIFEKTLAEPAGLPASPGGA